MTRGEMLKISFRPYMAIDYKPERSELVYDMFLVAIDFDREIMTLCPTDLKFFANEDYIVSISTCSIPKKKICVVGDKPPDYSKWPAAIKNDFISAQIEDDPTYDPAS